MQSLNVALDERSYPIYIGQGLLNRGDLLAAAMPQRKAVIVSNSTVAPLYLAQLKKALVLQKVEVFEIVLPDGESYKDWQTLNLIFDGLLGAHCERGTTLVALGGGVIGDMGGFAAACYQRGMPFVQVPTTLLAQVDSSVGGKTAINHPLGKNMIGAFYQPRLVMADIDTFETLPEREFCSGLAEVIKYGLIRDIVFFEWLERNMGALLKREAATLEEAIFRSCTHKAEVVAVDERETGDRALLNLGHTFGHAIETGLGYGLWLHGEAVAVGTVMAAQLSQELGWLDRSAVRRVEQILLAAQLPIRGPQLGADRYLELMRHDKKMQEGKMRLVLLCSIGRAVVSDRATEAEIAQAIKACCI